ncbi:MAG: hypothetical protein WC441_00795 [Patescibacteria group bacterium]
MLKKSTIPISLMLLSLVVFSIVSIKTALAAGYVNVTNGYQILVNQGIVNLTAQTRSINIDTSKVTTSFFIPTKTVGEVDSYLASPLHTAVQQGGDTTPPTFTLVSLTPTQNYTYASFSINENGYYKFAQSTSGYPSEPGTAWMPMTANSNYLVNIGGQYNTFYYYRIFYKDAADNSGVYSGTLTTASDTQAPSISISYGPALSSTNPPAYEINFYMNENGQYGFAYSPSSYPDPATNQSATAYQVYNHLIGDQANTGYYYTIKAKDAAGNTSTHQNYVVTTSDTTGPVLSEITDSPGHDPATLISFISDEAGEYQILYAATEEDLMNMDEPVSWETMSAGNNGKEIGDETVNTNFYYIIYARDTLFNTSNSGVLTVGSPGSDDGNPDISIVGQRPSATPPAMEILIQNDGADETFYQLFWSIDREYINTLKDIEPAKNGQALGAPGRSITELVGDTPYTHYFYRIFTQNPHRPETINSTNSLELDTEGGAD